MPLGILEICISLVKCKYLKSKKLFLKFLFRLWHLHQIVNIFEKKMIVIANVFPKLQTVKDLVKPLSWKRCFRISLDNQNINGCETLLKSAWEHFYQISGSLWTEMTSKRSPLLKFEILEVFVNTLTDDENYFFGDSGDLQLPSQMQIS